MPQIQRRADEFPLGAHALDTTQAELAEPQHALDPAVGRLCDPFAFAVGGTFLIGLHLRGHGRGVRQSLRIDARMLLALASQGHDQCDRRVAQLCVSVLIQSSWAQAPQVNRPGF
jgi:hypothetical protein